MVLGLESVYLPDFGLESTILDYTSRDYSIFVKQRRYDSFCSRSKLELQRKRRFALTMKADFWFCFRLKIF